MRIVLAFYFASICFSSLGQTRQWFASGAAVLAMERREAKIYGSGIENRTSKTFNPGVGFRASYLRRKLKFGMGMLFVIRKYDMTRPYDHCYFNRPGEPCDFVLAHVDKYSYKTIEIPLSIDTKLLERGKLIVFGGGAYRTAFVYNASYHSYYPSTGTKNETHSFERFSTSINFQVSLHYKLSDKVNLNAEPFARIRCRQRNDKILMEQTPGWQSSSFDSFGLLIELAYRL
jgi:hypothetical protein